jgi:outer membrane cobalamin receptor
MEEVVVTATRYPSALEDIAQATTVVEKEEIEQMPVLTVSDILELKAGIDAKQYGNRSSVTSAYVRGIPANATLVLVDGHPVNTITTGTADMSMIHIREIERIEIIRGPVSSFYGANGLGGVINIITTRHVDRPEMTVNMVAATEEYKHPLETRELFGRAAAPWGNTQFDFSGAYTSSDGTRSNSDGTQHHFQADVNRIFGPAAVRGWVMYDDKEYGVPGPLPRADRILPDFGDSTATSLFDREHDKVLFATVACDWSASHALRLHTKFTGNRQSRFFHTVYAGWLGDTIIEDYDYVTYSFGLSSVAVLALLNDQIALGCDLQYDTLRTTQESAQQDTSWYASSSIIGAWLELKKQIGTMTVIPRVRFDRNSDYGSFVSPGFGMVSSVAPDIQIKVSLERAFRAPTFNDLYWPLGGNPGLVPEKGWAYELRCEAVPVYRVFSALSFFMRDVQDRIVWLPADNGLWQPQNANRLAIRGIDVEMRSQINDAVGVFLEGAYVHARQKNSEVVYDFYDWVADTGRTIIEEIERDAAFTPRFRVAAGLTVRPGNNIVAAMSALFVTEQVTYYPDYGEYPSVFMQEKVLDGYAVINMSARTTMFGYLTIGCGIRNLFDVQYATQFGFTVDDRDYPMPGRLVYMQLEYQLQ